MISQKYFYIHPACPCASQNHGEYVNCTCLYHSRNAAGITNGRTENRKLVIISQTFAHEIAHMIGISHDFDSNQNRDIARTYTCGPKKTEGGPNNQVMNYGKPRQPTWSECSNEDFRQYYRGVKSRNNGKFCLKGL